MRARDWSILAALLLAAPSIARADEPWLLSLEGSAALAVTTPQSEWFEPGGSIAVAIWRSVASPLAIGARLRGGLLADGPAPRDATLADPGIGSWLALTLGARLRVAALWDEGPSRGTGLWLDALGGVASTGSAFRPSLEIGLGFGVEVGDAAIAPVVRWATVFETDAQLEASHANLLLFGIEITLLDARAPAQEPSASLPEAEASEDHCPDEEEDLDGFEDEDGCPDPDNDRDGIADASDACPNDAEDLDGIADADGCPEIDADGDAIRDEIDACPLEREVVNGIDDADGCPDEGLIELVNDRVVLEERVLFTLNRARIRHRAWPTLDAIVTLYRQHPEWVELRIEGHADIQGTRDFNLRLSELRAQRVRDALVERGIRPEIISSVGHGEARPRVFGFDEAAHEANRRVEFVVIRRAPASATNGRAR